MDFSKVIGNYKTIITQKYVCFEGCAGREEFWYFFLVNFVISFVLDIVGRAVHFPFLSSLFALAVLLPNLAVTARRLHDIGKSGWLQLIALIPVIGVIIVLILCAQPGKAAAASSEGSEE